MYICLCEFVFLSYLTNEISGIVTGVFFSFLFSRPCGHYGGHVLIRQKLSSYSLVKVRVTLRIVLDMGDKTRTCEGQGLGLVELHK